VKIESLVLHVVQLPLRDVFENRWQRLATWTKLLVEVQADAGVAFGECTAMETPYYCPETIETVEHVITRHLAELLLGFEFAHPNEIAPRLAIVSGHHEAKGVLESACWELYARGRGEPLHRVLGGSTRLVASGATVAVGKDLDRLLEGVAEARARGYGRVKLKVKPGWDEVPLAAVRAAHPDLAILADANGGYDPRDVEHVARLARFAPIVLEQPFPASAWLASAALQRRIDVPVCLDEAITCTDDVALMLHLGAARMVNLKIGRVGGLGPAIQIHDRLHEAGIPAMVGAKFETSLGRRTNIALATLPNIRYPSDVSESARYFTHEITTVPVTLAAPGMVQPLDAPGFGGEIDRAVLARHTVRTLRIAGRGAGGAAATGERAP
jgi:O-succinylbenzoate synthase